MSKPSATALSLLVGAALLAAPALSADGGRKLEATLSGAAEVPGPADPDGAGAASVAINAGQRQICYTLSVSNIDPATMAHIHKAPPGVAGPVVAALTAPTSGSSKGCATVAGALALDILKSPANYYINIHNEPFPAGALRGQLAK
ncbi:MAG TPA: CHRD domain-containing protein [Allosphingosinicella sp.]|jgi:hypothetical protein